VPSGVTFEVATKFGLRAFRLPANIAGVEAVLREQRGVPRRLATREQAARVAWRILLDWIEAQLAIVEAGMATVDEVMLPYMADGQGGTLYQFMVARQLALPGSKGGV
jgi:hypothetical protein